MVTSFQTPTNNSKKGYLILRANFEYNDEINYSTDGGEGVQVFTDKEVAEKHLAELQAAAFSGCRIKDYSYELAELCDDIEGLLTAVNQVYNNRGLPSLSMKDIDDYDFSLPLDLSIEEYETLKSHLHLYFYYLQDILID